MTTRVLSAVCLAGLLVGGTIGRGHAVGTAFTYQGQLQQTGTPRNGPCDFHFSLFDAATAGTQVGPTLTPSNVTVTNGLFTVQLDFGAAAFTGPDRFLQIELRCPEGSGTFTTLAPRQALTASPYTLFSNTIADNAVNSAKIADASIATVDLANAAVTDAKVANGIAYSKLAGAPTSLPPSGAAGGALSGTYPNPSLAANAVTADKITDGTISSADVNTASVQARVGGTCATGSPILDINTNGAVTCDSELQARVAALESQVATLQTLLAAVSLQDGGATLRFTGVNVQVVSGSGTTHAPVNGRGNLIVGYNVDLVGEDEEADTRTGSHNVVIGDDHSYTSSGGLVAGEDNAVFGVGASVTAGTENVASGRGASVSGGVGNVASGFGASITGGLQSNATGNTASVSGGGQNTASGSLASVLGGHANVASGTRSSVSGGADNRASAEEASVSGGEVNVASGNRASVSGGARNVATGENSSVSGGDQNRASEVGASVSGGACSVAGPGFLPTCLSPYNAPSVSGGFLNAATGSQASVSGGSQNTASGTFSSVTGGDENTAAAIHSSVSGGTHALVTGAGSAISGGDLLSLSIPNAWKAGSRGNLLGPNRFFSE